jgi:type I restriction enzyme S subunit
MYGQGKTRGKTGLLGIEASTNQACCAVLPKPEKFNPRYLQFWFMYMCRELREQSEDRGGNQPNLNSGMIKALKPPLPDKEVQLRVIQYVESIIEEVTEMQRIQTDDHLLLEEVEQSILAQAFRGEL